MLYQYSQMKEGFSEEISLEVTQNCHVYKLMFDDGLISKVIIHVHRFDDKNSVHITLYMGNLKLATVVTYEDFIVEYGSLGNVENHYLRLRKAESFDYS